MSRIFVQFWLGWQWWPLFERYPPRPKPLESFVLHLPFMKVRGE